jgi:MraZ protein
MFVGRYEHTLDEKKRVALPARFRNLVEHGVVITRGPDHCLWILPRDKWEQIAAKLDSAINLAGKDSRLLTRLFFSGAVDEMPDNQRRVRIPDYLLKYAGIDSDVIIVGMNSRLEIWSRERWLEQEAYIEEHPEEISEHFASMATLNI